MPDEAKQTLRKQVARIVDDQAWGVVGRVYDTSSFKSRRHRSLVRADAILEALSQPTEEMVEAGARAYHETCRAAREAAKQRNGVHEAAGRGRPADEQVVVPFRWLPEVWVAMLTAAMGKGIDDG